MGHAFATLRTTALVSALALAGGCVGTATDRSTESSPVDRGAEDLQQDAWRYPSEILAFAGVRPGMVVLDYVAGGGYYTALLAEAVGPLGHVYAHRVDPERTFPGNVERVGDGEPADTGVLDLALLVRCYHDLVNLGMDRGALLQQLRGQLKPGGTLLLVDHSAVEGSGTEAVRSLHRIDEELVVREFEAAGFELLRRSSVLRNPTDKRRIPVFDRSIRGQTDRFVLLFGVAGTD